MGKLIKSVTECGHRLGGLCFYGCDHSYAITIAEAATRHCQPEGEQNFPHICPLEDGKPVR